MTEPNLDEILQKLCDYVYNAGASAKHNGIFVGGEPKKEASQAIKAIISDQVAKARIEAVDYYAWRFDCNTAVSELYGWRDTLERAKEQTLRHFDATLNGVTNK